MAGWPHYAAALVWDQQHGWGLAVEPAPGWALRILVYEGDILIPEPEAVIAFANRVLTEGTDSRPGLPPDLACDDALESLFVSAGSALPATARPMVIPETVAPSAELQ